MNRPVAPEHIARNTISAHHAPDIDRSVAEALQARLKHDTSCEVRFEMFDRGRYATDASHYQILPLGVVIPKTEQDLAAIIEIARELRIPITGRGGGTSQNGQTINRGLIVDYSKYLNQVIEVDSASQTCEVQPGLVLDHLNAQLKPTGLWYPVDASTSSRANVLGGMTGNNSCGSRSIRYGTMRDNVLGVEAILADGSTLRPGQLTGIGTTVDSKTTFC